ncbi:hypothetical protein K2173_011329 [Erythroxylum novogranatense]|uniref:Lipoxygenase n=1 Tax=Erythroxylum novogranatense TaxID=1862640 RepID=A0AAV8S9M1_9ROSI|nr:hypothetical protein K2173_011329 [Erythroxylum novogranatense]
MINSTTTTSDYMSSLLPKPPPLLMMMMKLRSVQQHHFHHIKPKASHSSIHASATTHLLDSLSQTSPSSNPLSTVTATVTVKPDGLFSRTFLSGLLYRNALHLELVSADLDPDTGLEKETVKSYAYKVRHKDGVVKYEAKFRVPTGFGEIGAVLVENERGKEIYIENIVIRGLTYGPINVSCNSWVHSKHDNPEKRVFFTQKSYLPSDTPSGLRRLREKDMEDKRGNGGGERKSYDRIYDYDTYNDLGNPDQSQDLARPVLGGNNHPYPRRCRTGRSSTKTDPSSESRSSSVYVPRDEAFSDVKQATFSAKTLRSVLHALVPQIEMLILDPNLGFTYFTDIDQLFNQQVVLPKSQKIGFFRSLLANILKVLLEGVDILEFETPAMMNRDTFAWFRDEEFCRQTLAGLNPLSIQLVKEWPLKSKLDPEIYGPPESNITTELVERHIKGVMSVEEALEKRKMYMLDYHDLLLPYVNKVRELEGTTLYGSRTLFFLTPDDTLQPVAIELVIPPMGDKPQWKQVFTPSHDATACWLWKLAKAHVSAHDAGYHQLVIHWLRTHCCTEPYIIAANRQLSEMHPIYRLLHPHFRYTMEINALARESLINGGGIIETTFSSGKYSVEISSIAYDQSWRFDNEALPADLIQRGMAVEDPSAKHGLRLMIQDYPYASDGLILWDAIKQWVTDYVNHYYADASSVVSDNELQAWWTEVRTEGHADKKDEPWWPVLRTPTDVIHTLTTIIWVASGHHAAVNFGQYVYGGYFPNRPTIARTKLPIEDPSDGEEHKLFLEKPEVSLLKCFPTQIQATKVMAVLDVLSSHSPDEEYIGEKMEPSWEEDPVIKTAFERLNLKLKELDAIIDQRNGDLNLKNRTGAGVVAYELLKPFSTPGVTGKGVPNSISI